MRIVLEFKNIGVLESLNVHLILYNLDLQL